MKEDGGYIAIRGFAYQFDKSILDILQNPDTTYQVENIQDLNFEDYAIQIKYYGTEHTPARQKQLIKETTINLLKNFKESPSISYCIYAHFKGVTENIIKIDTDALNNILGKEASKFDDDVKKAFAEDFTIIYAPDFKSQFKTLLEEIAKSYKCDIEIACCYHALLYSHLERLVLKYKLNEADKRECSKTTLDQVIHSNKEAIFRTSYAEFLGKTKFHKKLHKQYFNRNPIKPMERIFIIEPPRPWSISDLKNVLTEIANRWSKNSTRQPNKERCSPFFHIRIPAEDLVKIKEYLFSESVTFKDGHYFKGSKFNPQILVAGQTKESNFNMMFINEEHEIEQTLAIANRPQSIFQFYYTLPIEIEKDVRHIKIQIDNLDDILEIA